MARNKSRDIGVSVKEMLPFKAAARHVSLYLTLLLLLLLSAIAAADAAGNDAISVSSYLSKPLMRRDVSALAALHDSIDEDDDSGHYHDNNNDDDDDDDDDDHEPHTDDENDKSDVKHVNALHSKRQLTNELKADRDFDFAAYVNDFNLQEEASIPEDIFDQRHAQNGVSDADMVDVGSKLQYAAADVAPVAIDNDDEHDATDDKDDGDDDDDDNDDESEVADIILESQRPTSRNFTVYLDGVTNASNNNNKGNTKKYRNKSNNNNKSNKVNYNYNYKFKNNKENLQVGNEEQSSAGATKFTSADDVRHFAVPAAVAVSVEVDAEKDTDEDVVGNADNVANKSFAYKKLKHMHEQQNQQNQKEQQQANANSQLKLKPDQEQQQQQQQLFDSIEILNERKFNKATVAQSTLEQVMEQPTVELQLPDEDENENENEDEAQAEAEAEAAAIADAVEIPGSSRVKLKESHRNNDAGIMAIGDIEDNFGNDEVLAENIKSTIDNDESAKMLAMTTMSALPMMTATIATATTTSTTTTTRPSTTTTKSSSSTISSGLVGSSYQQPQQQQQLIGRKHKRHGSSSISGTGTASNRYYDIGRVMAKAKDADDADKDNDNNDDDDDDDDETYETDVLANTNANAQLDDDLLNVGELHFYDGKKHAGKSQANYLDSSGSHFGHSTINETQQQQQQKRQQQHAPRFIDDEYAEEQQQSAPALRYQDATESPSAFERFKALRRSHRRNGHKAHKKRYKDYLRYSLSQASSTTQKPATTTTSSDGTDTQLLNRQQKHALKLLQEQHQPQQQKQQQQSHAAPIFALGLRQQQRPTLKPFYEGQINYYEQAAESSDVSMPSEQVNGHNIERMIATDNSNWYRRISPVLRNGIKTSDAAQSTQQQQPQQHHKPPHHGKHHHQYHQHHQHHQRQHQQQQLHHHHRVHHRQRQPNPYQRKPATAVNSHQSMARTTPPPQPLPPPSYKQRNPLQELGHQITEMEELERYYAKWPHLARVQFQVYDEHYRETHPELYTDYDEDYESAAELEEAQQEHGAEANLPPYIKKYNRRNKQLLNLLEGTLPPITQPPPLRAASWSSSLLQPGPHDSSSSSSSSSGTAVVRLDDDYLKEKRRRYHNHRPQQTQLFEDLFAMQRSSTVAPPTTTSLSNPNQLPDEQLDISREHPVESNAALSAAVDFWQKEIEAKSNANQLNGSPQMSWQIENAGAKSMDSLEEASAPATTTKPAIPAAVPTTSITPKPALFKLPSYPAIADSFMATPRSRSRNSQFVSNVSGRAQAWRFTADAAIPPIYPLSSTTESHTLATAPGTQTGALNSFVYHRVMDASPRLVGAGISSRKQRLPFVAITDRRLETSKKLLAERHKDFEQNNHFPMP